MLAISGDIISEVAAAADPLRAAATRRRLEAMSTSGPEQFGSLVSPSQAPPGEPVNTQPQAAFRSFSRPAAPRGNEKADPVASAYRALGGVLLQKTFETMMPKLPGLSGASASASSVWSSLLAQQLAESISASVFHLSRDPANVAASRATAAGNRAVRISTEG